MGQEDLLEKGMATHSSVLAWRIPGTGEPGGLPSMGSHKSDLAAAAAAVDYITSLSYNTGYRLPKWLSSKESACQCRRHRRCGFNSWVEKIPLEKEMATHSSILAWRIPWTEEPGGLQSTGSQSQTRLSD